MSTEQELQAALLEGYEHTGREVGYWAHYFLRSLKKQGGVATARNLLAPGKSRTVSKGFQAIRDAGRLDLSLESIVLQPRFRKLFTEAELDEARRRLQWTTPRKIEEIAEEINRRAGGHAIGGLQELRRTLRGLNRVSTKQIFDKRTTFETYAYHVGGRTELQFNIGTETIEGEVYRRHGVAFSLELSQTLPAIDPLLPKIRRFNEYLRIYPDAFSDLRMWHSDADHRSDSYAPAAIPPENARAGVFIFLGKLQPADRPDVSLILEDFDRLLALYRFVESDEAFPEAVERGEGFVFSPGCTVKPPATRASVAAKEIDVQLRHNEIQVALHVHLVGKHGEAFVGTEQNTGQGTFVDAVTRVGGKYWFYEIKTGSSARACIREGLAQLLEYAFWPGAQEAERLIVVGEAKLDAQAEAFLEFLRQKFSLPVYYQCFDMKRKALV